MSSTAIAKHAFLVMSQCQTASPATSQTTARPAPSGSTSHLSAYALAALQESLPVAPILLETAQSVKQTAPAKSASKNIM